MDLLAFQQRLANVLAGQSVNQGQVGDASLAAWLKMLAGFDELLCLPLVQIERLPPPAESRQASDAIHARARDLGG